jgi:hypothetical protein
VIAGYSQDKSQTLTEASRTGVGLVPLLPVNEKEARSIADLKKV